MFTLQPKTEFEIERLAQRWEDLGPPFRPSADELALFDLSLRSLPAGSPVLIIGDSPELRDLTAKYHLPTVIAADNLSNILAMRQLRRRTGGLPEKVWVVDWRQMQTDKDKFAMVLIDFSLNSLVEWDDYGVVLGNIYKLLQPGGKVAARIGLFLPQPSRSAAAVIDDMLSLPQHKFSWWWELVLHSQASIYDKKSFQLDLGRFFRHHLPRLHQQGLITDRHWQEVSYSYFDYMMTVPSKQEWEEMVRMMFDIKLKKTASDYIAGDQVCFYILQKNIPSFSI